MHVSGVQYTEEVQFGLRLTFYEPNVKAKLDGNL
jgi:hypothetical protein